MKIGDLVDLFLSNHSSGALVNKPSKVNSNISILYIYMRPCKASPLILHCVIIYSPVSVKMSESKDLAQGIE